MDPLEGLYDVEVTQQGENAFQRFPAEKTQFNLFIKKNSRGDLIVGNYKSGEIFDWAIERIGDTDAYNFKQSWQAAGTTNERVYLTNGVQFTRDFDIPKAQLQKDLGRNYQAIWDKLSDAGFTNIKIVISIGTCLTIISVD